MSTGSILESALALASLGIPVFPLRSNKRPCTEHGFKAASTDPETVRRMFADPLAALIGVPTGAVSGFDVLDIDPSRAGDEWLRENESRLPPARRHHTRSGGVHILLKHTPGMGNSSDRIAPGVDVRGDGGYCVWWPAQRFHASGDVWGDWPDWLLIQALRNISPNTPVPNAEDLAPPDAAALLSLLADMPNPAEATRDDYTFVNLAVQGCVRSLEALGRLDDPAPIYDAAAEWSARWDSASASSFGDERRRWDDDWSQRDRDISGFRHLLGLAGKLGADVSAFTLAEAVAEFGALPPEPESERPAGGADGAEPARPTSRTVGGRPQIYVTADTLPLQVDAAENALVGVMPNIYQANGSVVRIDRRDGKLRTHTVTEPHLHEIMCAAAVWVDGMPGRKQGTLVSCPRDVPKAYLARPPGSWQLRELRGVLSAPTLRSDGSWLSSPGYDAATGLILDMSGAAVPIIENPGKHDAQAALRLILDLFRESPFLAPEDRSVAVAAVLTACIRPSLPSAPMFAFTASTPGTGKSYLVDLVHLIAFGERASGIGWAKSKEENQKVLDSVLLAGNLYIALDNVSAPIGGDRLNQALTQARVSIRMLGRSQNFDVPSAAFMTANGNNLSVAEDMTRRVMLCRLDANMERPAERRFTSNPADEVKADRGPYVAAALTILRAFHLAGRPGNASPLGSFETWSQWVRGAILWLGQADPVKSMNHVRASDPGREAHMVILEGLLSTFGSDFFTASEIKAASYDNAGLDEALKHIAGGGTGERVDSRRLGHWLRAKRGVIVAGLAINEAGLINGMKKWRLAGDRVRSASERPSVASEFSDMGSLFL
ncbi:MAG: bifunctional DNA primase/polymerase [Rhodopila sp.]|nr:bifunctional DNA primase/polymerase [Rhodopila sp.]